ncbi:MAG TPA: GspH/FimT family pseudopilin [Gammaproteobacteria bacterium]|nr:GspH/FimT family pseudopilin [Gammaproteobacteria bacterium]
MRGLSALRAGFTLTEMLVVVALLAAFAVIAVPLLSAPDPARVELAAAELVQALRYARSEAERTGTPHGLRVDAAGGTAQMFRLDTAAVPPARDFAVYHPVDRQLFALDFAADSATRDVQIAAAAFSFAAACAEARDIVFDASGTPLCADPAGVAVTSATIDLTDGRSQRRVAVAAVTGRVTVQ